MIETRCFSLFGISQGKIKSSDQYVAPGSYVYREGNMAYGYKLSAWLVEMVAEAVVLPLLPMVMFDISGPITARDIAALAIETLTFFCISGYVVTTLATRFALRGTWAQMYPIFAPLLFLTHFEVMNLMVPDGLLDVHNRLAFRVLGSAVVLVVTTAIELVLKLLATNRPATSAGPGKETVDAN